MSTHRFSMWHGLVGLALSLAASSLYDPPSALAQAAPSSTDATIEVAMRGDDFDPANITVPTGTTVRWTNLDGEVHTSTSATGRWNSGAVSPGVTYSFSFTTPGTFLYYCTVHRESGMVGRVVVSGTSVPPGPGPEGNLALGKPVRASSAQAGNPPNLANAIQEPLHGRAAHAVRSFSCSAGWPSSLSSRS